MMRSLQSTWSQPEGPSLIQLAQKTFPLVAEVASKLASDKGSRELGELGAYLCTFAEETLHLSPQQKGLLESSGRIGSALRAIENVISIPSNDATAKMLIGNHYGTIQTIADFQDSVDQSEIVALPALDAIRKQIRKKLRKLGREDLKLPIALVQACSEIRQVVLPNFMESDSMPGDLPEYPRHSNVLHEVLSKHISCTCTGNDSCGDHWIKLRLKPSEETNPNRSVPFEMLFSSYPDPPRMGVYEWQDVQIEVSSSTRALGRVQFSRSTPSHSNHSESTDDSDIVEHGQLCSFISSRCRSRLRFKVDAGQLRAYRESGQPQHINSTAGINMGNVIEKFRMRHGTRPILAYILAKSVWQYYNSKWMTAMWTNNSIYFMEETSEEDEAYFCKPYVSLDLANSANPNAEYKGGVGVMHRYPKILALGIMLFEIATGQLRNQNQAQEKWDSRAVNEELGFLQNYLLGGEFWEDCRFPMYKVALKNCLDPKLFKNAPYNRENPQENLERRRSIIFDKVVKPLKQLVEGTGWSEEFGEIEQVPMVPATEKTAKRTVPVVTPASEEQYEDRGVLSKCQRRDWDQWLERIEEANRRIKLETKHPLGSRPIRIAILDTGCSIDAPFFEFVGQRRRIKGWRDWVEHTTSPTDCHGHGTHLATLLLQVAPHAEIFIARVAENSQTLYKSDANVSEAIRVAALEWDVDIISMSFGFAGHVELIQEAISEAVYKKKKAITFFAAAANDGSNRHEMFPANLGESVISIRGTDRHGAFEQSFNPPRCSDEPVFGTLSRDVWSDWVDSDEPRSMSGCSVATPIAAGIAAMLIDYAIRSGRFEVEELRLMRTRRGIFELFKEIGVHAGDGRYYVAPFNLFGLRTEDRLAKLRSALSRLPEYS